LRDAHLESKRTMVSEKSEREKVLKRRKRRSIEGNADEILSWLPC